MPTPNRYWADMTSEEFRTLSPDTVVILPIGAIEQHGPHLPVSVDTDINTGLVARALEKLPANVPVLVLPIQSVGKSDEHDDYPGTLSLTAQTLTDVCMQMAASVHRAGLRKLMLLNSHGGQPQVLDIVARDVRRKHNMFVVHASWGRFGFPPGLFPAEELRFGIHAGDYETSLMLYLHPHKVRTERQAHFRSTAEDMAERYDLLQPEGRVGFGWLAQDLNPAGACGNALAATADKGRQLAEYQIERFLRLVEEVVRYPIPFDAKG